MKSALAHGRAFARRFGAGTAPAFFARTLTKAAVGVTYLRQTRPTFQLSEPQPLDDAYLISVGFGDYPDYRLWADGRPVATGPVRAQQVTMYDLRTRPYILVNGPLVGVHFHVPRSALQAFADGEDAGRVGDLRYPPGHGIDDPAISMACLAMLPAFERPAEASRLFVEHVTLGVTARAACAYGGVRLRGALRTGGLSPGQLRRARDLMDAQAAEDLSLGVLARECSLSVSHFARAFRASTGLAPHQWLTRRRVQNAQAALLGSDRPLSDIATACGFADQSHFTRVFTKLVGVPPGAWRRGR
jgi:AraC family transcriptional regulator